MTIRTGPVTAEELLRKPDDGFRYELVEGELRKTPPAGSDHGYIALRVASRLERHVTANALGRAYAAETGFLIARDPDTVRAPDAAFVSRERVEKAGHVMGYWPGAPDLAVEVTSPSDTHTEVMEKALAWLKARSHMVLVVDPSQRTDLPLARRHPYPHRGRLYRRRRRGTRLEVARRGAVYVKLWESPALMRRCRGARP